MEGVTRRFRTISSIEEAALSAIANEVKPDEIIDNLWASYAIEEDFNCEDQNPKYKEILHDLREGFEFLQAIAANDWTHFRSDGSMQQDFAMRSQCDKVTDHAPGNVAPFLSGVFSQAQFHAMGLEGLIVRLAELQDKFPKLGSSGDWQERRAEIAGSIRKHLNAEIDEAERVLAEFLKPPFDYHAYLRSPEWKAKRDARVVEAGRRCQVCNSTHLLECHHRTYERIGNELPEDLIVLCRECHQIFHDNGKLKRPDAK